MAVQVGKCKANVWENELNQALKLRLFIKGKPLIPLFELRQSIAIHSSVSGGVQSRLQGEAENSGRTGDFKQY